MRDQATVERLLKEMGEHQTPFDLDNAEVWAPWWEAIVTAGIYAGHASEVHRLCVEASEFGSIALDAWERISRDLRNDSGHYPDQLSQVEAVEKAHRRYTHTAVTPIHPADTRLSDGWRAIWLTAKKSDFCNVWDDMAEQMGIPQPELPTRSGTVTVSGSFSVAVPVSGVAFGESAGDFIDHNDIIRAMEYYDIEIHDIEDEDLEVDE